MKKYIIPEMKLSRFESESVVTESGTQQTALEQAQNTKVEGSQKTFTVMY